MTNQSLHRTAAQRPRCGCVGSLGRRIRSGRLSPAAVGEFLRWPCRVRALSAGFLVVFVLATVAWTAENSKKSGVAPPAVLDLADAYVNALPPIEGGLPKHACKN